MEIYASIYLCNLHIDMIAYICYHIVNETTKPHRRRKTMELTINERIHLLSLLLGEVQRLEAYMQIETTPAIAKLQRETYDESREIYHKLMQ